METVISGQKNTINTDIIETKEKRMCNHDDLVGFISTSNKQYFTPSYYAEPGDNHHPVKECAVCNVEFSSSKSGNKYVVNDKNTVHICPIANKVWCECEYALCVSCYHDLLDRKDKSSGNKRTRSNRRKK